MFSIWFISVHGKIERDTMTWHGILPFIGGFGVEVIHEYELCFCCCCWFVGFKFQWNSTALYIFTLLFGTEMVSHRNLTRFVVPFVCSHTSILPLLLVSTHTVIYSKSFWKTFQCSFLSLRSDFINIYNIECKAIKYTYFGCFMFVLYT